MKRIYVSAVPVEGFTLPHTSFFLPDSLQLRVVRRFTLIVDLYFIELLSIILKALCVQCDVVRKLCAHFFRVKK